MPELNDRSREQRIRQGLQRLCIGAAALLLGGPIAMHAFCWPLPPPDAVSDLQRPFVVLAFFFLLTNGLLYFVPVRFGLAGLTSLLSISGIVVLLQFSGYPLVSEALLTLNPPVESQIIPRATVGRRTTSLGIYRFDDVYGYGHQPNAEGIHEQYGFKVVYRIDHQGQRATPTPDEPAGQILISGCSFTFGYGVDESECYPTVLGTRYWTEDKVHNAGVSGYGTVHSYLRVLNALNQEQPDRPTFILYAMIPDHVRRNYLRESWVSHIMRGFSLAGDPKLLRRGHPHFEFVEGNLESMGLVLTLEDTVDDFPSLSYLELLFTEAFLLEMHNVCSNHMVPFAVVLLPELGADEYTLASLRSIIAKHSIPCLDLSELKMDTIADGIHPNASTHRAIAEKIAERFR